MTAASHVATSLAVPAPPAVRPLDNGVNWIYGYGFPRHRDGSMLYAVSIGLNMVYEAKARLRDSPGG